MSSLVYKKKQYGGTATVQDADHVLVDMGSGSVVSAQDLFEELMSAVQQSAFEVVVEDGEYVLYWYGVSGECPFSVVYENGEYVLYFNYEVA